MVLNYQFFSYSDEGDCIIIRYFTAGIVGGKKNSFEINKTTFSGYKIKSSFFGIIQSLVLFQKVQGGVATYHRFISVPCRRMRRQKSRNR